LKAFVSRQDVFYVGGGSTANLLSLWRAHGLDRLLANAWRSGAVLAGISAGMLCWFQSGLTDSFGGFQPLRDGLGLLRGAACPHYDSEPRRQGAFRRMIARDEITGYAADDGVGLHFVGRRLHEVVSSRPSARAYRLVVRRGKVVETALATRLLRGDARSGGA
jgi:peptidase E